MTPKLEALIRSVSAECSEAKRIAARLVSVSATEPDVSALQARIASLQARVLELEAEANHMPDAQFNDEEAAMFRQSFTKSLAELPSSMAVGYYDSQYFTNQPSNIRLLIASILVDHFNDKHWSVPGLWSNIISRGGEL